jgi:hypothetical protein
MLHRTIHQVEIAHADLAQVLNDGNHMKCSANLCSAPHCPSLWQERPPHIDGGMLRVQYAVQRCEVALADLAQVLQ